jgi:hypothetical protein
MSPRFGSVLLIQPHPDLGDLDLCPNRAITWGDPLSLVGECGAPQRERQKMLPINKWGCAGPLPMRAVTQRLWPGRELKPPERSPPGIMDFVDVSHRAPPIAGAGRM